MKRILVSGFLLVGFAWNALANNELDKFSTSDEDSRVAVDYRLHDQFFDVFAEKSDERVGIRYDAMPGAGLDYLDALVDGLENLTPTVYSRNEQLAYWLNLRNILVVRAIAKDEPGRSLKKARGTFEEPGPMWTTKRVTVEDVSLSIDDIERGVVLRNWRSPDVIYGLYQGTKGGPNFPVTAFRGKTVTSTLAGLAQTYVNNKGTLKVRGKKVRAPGVYGWYIAPVFDGDDQALITHLGSHAKADLAKRIQAADRLTTQRVNYSLDSKQLRRQRPAYSGGSDMRSPPSRPTYGGGAGS